MADERAPATHQEVVSLRDHLERRLDDQAKLYEQRIVELDRRYGDRASAQEAAVKAALASAERATAKAEVSIEARLASQNEFRQTLSDQAARLMPRAEAEAAAKGLSERLVGLASRMDTHEGTGFGMTRLWALIGGGLFLVLALVTFWMKARP
jgi:hypothetical protein